MESIGLITYCITWKLPAWYTRSAKIPFRDSPEMTTCRWHPKWHSVLQDRIYTLNLWSFHGGGPLIGRKHEPSSLLVEEWVALLIIISILPCAGLVFPVCKTLISSWSRAPCSQRGNASTMGRHLLQREKYIQFGECFNIFKWLLKAIDFIHLFFSKSQI